MCQQSFTLPHFSISDFAYFFFNYFLFWAKSVLISWKNAPGRWKVTEGKNNFISFRPFFSYAQFNREKEKETWVRIRKEDPKKEKEEETRRQRERTVPSWVFLRYRNSSLLPSFLIVPVTVDTPLVLSSSLYCRRFLPHSGCICFFLFR